MKDIHELHIWQLSDSKVIGSVHIVIALGSDHRDIVRSIKDILHSHGIHSSTVQPECIQSKYRQHSNHDDDDDHHHHDSENKPDDQESTSEDYGNDSETSCLLKCEEECKAEKCCS